MNHDISIAIIKLSIQFVKVLKIFLNILKTSMRFHNDTVINEISTCLSHLSMKNNQT